MVLNSKGRYDTQMSCIRLVLDRAEVPQRWYALSEARESCVSIVPYDDGIHIFIPERGRRRGEKVFKRWQSVIEHIAPLFEYKYTVRVNQEARNLVKEIAYQRTPREKRTGFVYRAAVKNLDKLKFGIKRNNPLIKVDDEKYQVIVGIGPRDRHIKRKETDEKKTTRRLK